MYILLVLVFNTQNSKDQSKKDNHTQVTKNDLCFLKRFKIEFNKNHMQKNMFKPLVVNGKLEQFFQQIFLFLIET